jgi:hypothetical protein
MPDPVVGEAALFVWPEASSSRPLLSGRFEESPRPCEVLTLNCADFEPLVDETLRLIPNAVLAMSALDLASGNESSLLPSDGSPSSGDDMENFFRAIDSCIDVDGCLRLSVDFASSRTESSSSSDEPMGGPFTSGSSLGRRKLLNSDGPPCFFMPMILSDMVSAVAGLPEKR